MLIPSVILSIFEYSLCLYVVASFHLQDLSLAGFGQPQSGLLDTVMVPYRPIP